MITDLIFLQFMFSCNNHIPSSLFCLYHLEGFDSQILGSVQEVQVWPMRFQFHLVGSGSGCVYPSSWDLQNQVYPGGNLRGDIGLLSWKDINDVELP